MIRNFAEHDLPWKLCYYCITLGGWLMYAWMVCQTIEKAYVQFMIVEQTAGLVGF